MVSEEATRIIDLYQRKASDWIEGRARTRLIEKPWLDRFQELLPPAAPILDIGCGAAAKIEDRRSRRQQRPEPVEPGFFNQSGACATLDPVLRLALIQIDDAGGFFRRHSGTHASRIDRTYSRSRKFEPISAFFLNGS